MIKHQSAKAKGRRLQQWVCQQISRITGIEWGEDEDISSRPMGQAGTDVRLTGQARQLVPLSIECKAQEKVSIWSAVKQAKKNCLDNTDWIVVLKRSRQAPVAVMDAERFFTLFKDRGIK